MSMNPLARPTALIQGCYSCNLRHSCDRLTAIPLSPERRGAIETGKRVTVTGSPHQPVGFYCVYWEDGRHL